MKKMSFVDTTLRDGHHSLWAMGMRTGMMAPVGEQLDEIGFKSIEVCGSGHLRKCIRELKENPWERIRLMANKIKKNTDHLHDVTLRHRLRYNPPFSS